MKVEKSPEAREKEKQVAALEKQLKRTRTTLKSLKTRLANTKTRIEDIQRNLFNKMSRVQEQFYTLADKLEQLTKKLRKDKRLAKADKEVIDEVYRGLVGGLKDNMPPREASGHDPDEDEKARFKDMFKDFKVEPPQEEQRDIRKLYLSLSKQFHPDMARGEKEKAEYHQLQQQIIEAYQRHDIQVLIDLEQLWAEDPQDQEQIPSTLDALDIKISRLQNQLELLQQQQARLSGEIEQLRKSDLGDMLTQVDSMERAGFSLEEGMQLDQLAEMVGLLEKLQEALEETDRLGKLSPLFNDFVDGIMGAAISLEDMMYGLMDMDYDEDDDFMSWEEEEEEPNPAPKFPIGSRVRIAKNEMLGYFDDYFKEHSFNVKGYTGTIIDALIDADGYPVYHLELDSASMKRLPGGYIESEGAQFHQLQYIFEEMLAKEKRNKPRESPACIQATYRQLLYQYLLSELPEEQQDRLRSILLAEPAANDESNWLNCFEERLPLPFTARTRGFFLGAPNRKVKVQSYGGYSSEDGVMVLAEQGKKQTIVPLAEFAGTDNGPVAELLNDYLAWFEQVL